MDSEAIRISRFLVVGLVRNGGKTLRRDISRIQKALMNCASVNWFLVESDSSDDTKEALDDLAGTVPGFDYVSLGRLAEAIPDRTTRMAFCRNTYAEKIRTSQEFQQIDYVVVADFDGVNALVDREGFLTCFDENWDGCFPIQKGPYYDVWALRHPFWSPNDCWREYDFFRSLGLSRQESLERAVYSRMVTVAPDSPWIEVDSAFGGFGVYRKSVFDLGEYRGVDSDGMPICEHVTFHSDLRARGCRLAINPRFINAGYTDHSRRMWAVTRMWEEVEKSLKLRFRRGVR